MSQDRRNFLKNVGTGAAAAAAVTKITEQMSSAADSSTFGVLSPARTGGQLKIALELGDTLAGWVHSVEGGGATGEVVTEKQGTDGVARKHIGNVKYEDITISCAAGMSKHFYEWISDTLASKGAETRRNGAIKLVDFDYNIKAVRTFTNAIISEVTFPALDAGSKDAAKLTLKFSPEVTRFKKGSGKVVNDDANSKQKAWLPSNFRLTIDGLEAACAKVSKVEALTIKQKVAESPVGELRDLQIEPTKIEFPNLKVSLADVNAEQFAAWHEDFVIKGNNGQEQEKSGLLEYLDQTRSKVLMAISLKGLGIFKYDLDVITAGANESPTQAKIEMYCEKIEFGFTKPNTTD
jgi:phage tail-like protein